MNFIHCPKQPPRPEERWTHVAESAYVEEDTAPDVFEHISKIETLTIERLNHNLNGIIMTSSIAQALTAANIVAKPVKAPRVRTVTADTKAKAKAAADQKLATALAEMVPTYHNYFDPIDVLEDTLGKYPVAHAKVMNSAAWTIDMACINAARNILFTRYLESERVEGEASKLNDFSLGIVEMISHQSFYVGDEDTPEKTLSTLLALRNHWHDAAASASSANGKDYNPKSFDDLLLSEKPRTANIGTRANYEMIAKLESGGDAGKQQRMLASFIQADELSAVQRAADNRKLIPTLSIILSTVARYAEDSTRFDFLPHDTQRKLTTQVRKSLDNAKLDMAKTLAREPIMFGHVLEACYQCSTALDKVLASKFSDAAELESAAVPHSVTTYNRRQKAIAAAAA